MLTKLDYEGPDLEAYRHWYHEIARATSNVEARTDGGFSPSRRDRPMSWIRDPDARRAVVNT